MKILLHNPQEMFQYVLLVSEFDKILPKGIRADLLNPVTQNQKELGQSFL